MRKLAMLLTMAAVLLAGCDKEKPETPKKPPPPKKPVVKVTPKPTPPPATAPATAPATQPAAPTTKPKPDEGKKNVTISGSPETIQFAVAWSTKADPAAAGKVAAQTALGAVGGKAKAIVFYTYYQDPTFTPDEKDQATACKADVAAEQAVAKAVNEACGQTPNIGCRARPLTNGGTLLKNAVAVLAIAGQQASVVTAAVPIQDDRLATGKGVAAAVKDVKDLKLVLALAEMRLSFEAKEGVSVEDFIRGVLDDTPKGTTLFGGNSMPDDMESAAGLAGAQFFAGKALKGNVVVLGLGGPVTAFGCHANEFRPSEDTAEVTEVKGKWIVKLDDKPAEEVYRALRAMKADEKLSSDWQHPIGVIVAPGAVYVRMVLNWVDKDGKDMDGKKVDVPPGSLRFVAPVVKGTKIKVLAGGDDAKAICASASAGIAEAVEAAEAANVRPALALISNCCARGMRLRTFRQGSDDEVVEAILPALKGDVPIFGFYAWGELGRIAGTYEGLQHQYQQHTFVSTLLGTKE